jgi:hypothetical protein
MTIRHTKSPVIRGSSCLQASISSKPHKLTEDYRQGFELFIRTLEEEVARFEGTVVLAHGDNHEFVVDAPLTDRRSGQVLANLTRLQVIGSPDVG